MIKSLLSIFQDSSNSFEGQGSDEKVLMLLRHHPFSISTHIGLFSLACLVPIIAGIIFLPYFSAHGWLNLFLFASSIWYLGFWLAIFYSLTIYMLNTVIITDRRIIESEQNALFNRKISELLSQRIQDVSTHTNGIIETFLRFGDVTVQTAARDSQFVFRQIPKPDKVKDVIIQIAATRDSGVKAVI